MLFGMDCCCGKGESVPFARPVELFSVSTESVGEDGGQSEGRVKQLEVLSMKEYILMNYGHKAPSKSVIIFHET